MLKLTKLADLNREVYGQYLKMAELRPKEVRAYMIKLIDEANASEEFTHYRYYNRAWYVVDECKNKLLDIALDNGLFDKLIAAK
jgi:hypothetical protein